MAGLGIWMTSRFSLPVPSSPSSSFLSSSSPSLCDPSNILFLSLDKTLPLRWQAKSHPIYPKPTPHRHHHFCTTFSLGQKSSSLLPPFDTYPPAIYWASCSVSDENKKMKGCWPIIRNFRVLWGRKQSEQDVRRTGHCAVISLVSFKTLIISFPCLSSLWWGEGPKHDRLILESTIRW